MGDPAGIGPDVILASWHMRVQLGLGPFVVYGEPETMRQRARALGWRLTESLCTFAVPAGPTVQRVYEAFRDEILADLSRQKRFVTGVADEEELQAAKIGLEPGYLPLQQGAH